MEERGKERCLAMRERRAKRGRRGQDDLLETRTSSTDWGVRLGNRKQVRRLEAMSESQLEALDAWRRGSVVDWNRAMDVRVRDVVEHATRVLNYARGQERAIEAAVQLHFEIGRASGRDRECPYV